MENYLDYPIGSTFVDEKTGKTLKVVAAPECRGCFYMSNIGCAYMDCTKMERADTTSVIFKEVENA